MKKRLMFATMVALAMLVVVTPVLAAGSGQENQGSTQGQGSTQNQEQNQVQNQEQNQEQPDTGAGNQHQEEEQLQTDKHHQEKNQGDANQVQNKLDTKTQAKLQKYYGQGPGSDAILGEVLGANRFVMSLVESVFGLLG
jgi:hypothetical protein